jgi:hypothetical protein
MSPTIKKTLIIVLIIVLWYVLYIIYSTQTDPTPADQTISSSQSLTASEIQALQEALDDEYKARETYLRVIEIFGWVNPFANIQRAEANHIQALVNIFEQYNIPIPENKWAGSVPSYASIQEACAAGEQAEIDNVAIYDRLFPMVQNPQIITVFQALQRASQEKHLPAFARCADRRQ